MIAAAVIACLLVIVGVIAASANKPPNDASKPSGALAKLATIHIKGRAPKTHYDRALFGTAWTDDVTVAGGHNGCDTRNDILKRDLTDITIKPGRQQCVVLSGILHDPYTGETINYIRGPGTSAQVQIDHIVPILDAWQKGAQQWDDLKRRNFANDPINLQTTIAAANRQKASGDAATWLPPNRAYWCTYAQRIVDVKTTYGVWITEAEHDALERILGTC